MTRTQQVLLVCGLLLVVVFDGILLRQLTLARSENATLQSKMTISLDQQFAINEHVLEGREFESIMRELRRAEPRYALAGLKRSPLTLLFYFPNRSSCRRSLHNEVAVLQEHRTSLDRHGIRVTMVFGTSIDEEDFQTMVRQFGISDIAILDRQGVFQRHLGPRVGALAIALDVGDRIVFAHFARTSTNHGARALYRKLDMVAALWSRSAR